MILTFIDHDRGSLNPLTLEMLTLARTVAAADECALTAVLIGADARNLVDELAVYGVAEVYLVLHEELNDFAPAAWAKAITEIIQTKTPHAVIGPGSERGNEVLAYLAAKTNLPLAANCTEIKVEGDSYQLTRLRWGGSLLEDAALYGETKLLTVAPFVLEATAADAITSPTVTELTPTLDAGDLRVRVSSRVQPDRDKVSLTDARVVVSGGRGVGSEAGFESLEELAALVGGAVGCSRVVTNEGWRPHADQVGQTGARVAPDLYIACGISGAIQHYAGCKGSKQILVINTDPNAPILAKADYAIIGDLHEVVPAVSEAIRNRGD